MTTVTPTNVNAYLYISAQSGFPGFSPTGLYVTWSYTGAATFTITPYINDVAQTALITTSNVTNKIFTNLTVETSYSFRVTATSGGITSTPSSMSNTELYTDSIKYSVEGGGAVVCGGDRKKTTPVDIVIPSAVYIATQVYDVKKIFNQAFDGNGSGIILGSFIMPDTLTDLMSSSIFVFQSKLKKIRYSSNLVQLRGEYKNTGIETLDLSNTKITELYPYSFNEMPNLTKILFPPSLTTIYRDGTHSNGTQLPYPNPNNRSTGLEVYFYGSSIPYMHPISNNFIGPYGTYHYPCIAYVLPNATNQNNLTSLVNPTYGNGPLFTDIKVFLPEPTDFNGYLYQTVDKSLPTGIMFTWNCVFSASSYIINIYDSASATTPVKTITSMGTNKTYTITSSDNLPSGRYYFGIQSQSIADNVISIESVRTSSIIYDTSLIYTINDSTTATITGSASTITEISIIPNIINIAGTNYTVNKIGDSAFTSVPSLISANISSNIQNIGISAFENCINLSTLTLPSNLYSIGNNAFKSCSSLTNIIFPSSLTTLGSSVFQNCSKLASISLSSTNISSIQSSTFDNCSLLTSLVLPTTLTTIDMTAILNCPKLSSISISSTNSLFSTDNGILFNKTKTALLFYPANITSTSYTIPSSVLSLEDYSIHDNSYLRDLTFNANIQTIGKYVFNNINLNMSFFYNVPTFDTLSFSNTANIAYKLSTTTNISNLSATNFIDIKTITAPTNIQLYSYIANVGEDISGIYASWTNSASSVTSMTMSLFLSNGTNALSTTNISNPSNAISFILNTGLNFNQSYKVKITITLSTGDSLTSDYSTILFYTNKVTYSINNGNAIVSGFKYNPSSVVINSQIRISQAFYSIIGIGSMAFRNCTTLTSITLPDTITTIDTYAFENCNALSSITLPSSISLIKKGAFKSCSLLSNIILPSFVTILYEEVFMNCSELTSINFSTNLTKISRNVFNGCSKITSIDIPDLLTDIDSNAFYNCNKLEQFTVSADNANYSVTDGILFNKTNTILVLFPMGKNVSTYTIPNTVTEISNYAFQQSLYITTLNLNNVTKIGLDVFQFCIFTTITIPDTLISIGDGAFSFCANLTTFVVNPTHPLFSVTDGILFSKDLKTLLIYPVGKPQTSYNIPSTVEIIGSTAFQSAQKLTSIILPKTVKTLGNSSFRFCINIPTISVPSSVTSIGVNAFADNPGLRISFLSITPLVFNLPSLNIAISSELVKLLEDSGVNLTGDVIVNVEISASIVNNTFVFKTTTPNSFDLTNTIYKVNASSNGYDDVIPKIETSNINYDGGVTSGYVAPSSDVSSLPYEYLCYVSHIKNNTTNGIRGILQVNSFISNMCTKIDNAFKAILQNLSGVEQPYSDSSNILSLSILQEINANDPTRLLNISGTTLGNNWYPNLVQPGDYLYYTVTIEPHPQQTGITQNRVYLFKAKVI